MTRGLLIAAPASGSGKTTITLGLLRHFRNTGVAVSSAKVGPDYIDPAFHTAASGRPCYNLDTWAMRDATLAELIGRCAADAELVIAEGVMGLFDGASDGTGSTADLARLTGWPVVLVVDASGMAASAAALVHGFKTFSEDVRLAGVIFNRVGGDAHARLLREACGSLQVPVLGCVPRDEQLALPDRHLGLVQAAEHPALDAFLEHAATVVSLHVDASALEDIAAPSRTAAIQASSALPPFAQRIAVARDEAFAFTYPFVLDGWRQAGAEIVFFSPLADEAPVPAADGVFLPGGYPELHAARLASNREFLRGLQAAARRGAVIYGECGGYMVLGRGLVDADAERHTMAGLLPVETSFENRRMTLGYRRLELATDCRLGRQGLRFRGHEFHFCRLTSGENEAPLFQASNAAGEALSDVGMCMMGTVMGSFVHLVDTAGS